LSWVYRNGKTEQWFFLPKLKTAKRVKAKEKEKSFMGTDFIYEDLESRKTGQDSLVLLSTEYLNGQSCQVILAFPKNESAYHYRKIWVDSLNWKILKIEYFSQESIKQKTLTISDFIEKNGFVIPTKMVMKKSNGNKTIMEIKNFKPNVGLKDEIFSESFLIKF
jgi:outer membrane lipoprotein-sorting protein